MKTRVQKLFHPQRKNVSRTLLTGWPIVEIVIPLSRSIGNFGLGADLGGSAASFGVMICQCRVDVAGDHGGSKDKSRKYQTYQPLANFAQLRTKVHIGDTLVPEGIVHKGIEIPPQTQKFEVQSESLEQVIGLLCRYCVRPFIRSDPL